MVTAIIAGSQTYTVTGTDANGCVNTAMVTQVFDNCTAIKTLAAQATIFSVYPNPNSGSFVVETSETAVLTVLNSVGQVVHQQTTTGSKTNISLDHLANGIYFVKVTANGNNQTVKIIKE
jgi:extracellular elastinolytic metalloproteinase